MASWATVTDVQDVYEQTVPSRTQAILDRAERRLVSLVPRIAERIALASTHAEYLDPQLVTDVLVESVCRSLRNPRGLTYEAAGEYSYRLADGSPGGWFTEEELQLLRPVPAGTAWSPVGTIQLGVSPLAAEYPRWPETTPDVLAEDGRYRP